MRVALLAAVLLVVLAASALNLALGAGWIAALLAVRLARRRARPAAWLVLLLALAAGAGASRAGWLTPPRPASYQADELAWVRERLRLVAPASPEDAAPPGAAARTRLAALRAEELGETSRDLERRAVAAIAASREAARLRARAPAEVAAVEEAVRQLALTLTAPEFRDLDGRRARLVEWLAAIDARLAAAIDPVDVAAAARGLEPAALAPVSLRGLREDLTRAEATLAALVRVLTGATVLHTATLRLEYDETRGELTAEHRHVFEAGPPLRLLRLDVGALRESEEGVARTLAYAADGDEPRPWTGGPEIGLGEAGAARVLVVERRVGRVVPDRVATAFRRIAFRRLALGARPVRTPALDVMVALDAGRGPALPLRVPGASPRLEGAALPRHAFHYASRPGAIGPDGGRDVWRPADDEAGRDGVRVELLPRTVLLRNAAFAALKEYLYTPNPAAALAGVVLAALAAILAGRRPAVPPGTPADPTAIRRS
ncbi:MAG: hypothetical protein HY359_17780 [Candidatus Rokubacteria bacterium]|nr:hypothetical protein [Candidatus Rokubacteria bacterium]